jgi:RNA polymerase sigma-70 factor (ECF subfamily)
MAEFVTEHPDRFLVARMVRGDELAFGEFFESHFPALFRFAMPRVGGDSQVAEDVVQAVLCRAVRKLSSYRGEAALLTWLCTFCRHEISAYFEKASRVPPMVELLDDIPEVRAALESLRPADRPEAALRRNETSRLVQIVLDRLPGHYGNALEWKYIDGLSVAEIAQRLGLGTKAAESMLTRARVAFRDAFTTAHGGTWSEAEVS